MAIKYLGSDQARGTAAERTGGTWTGTPTGYRFFETDTGLEYYWNGTAWSKAGGAPQGAAKITVYSPDAGTNWVAKSDTGAQLTTNTSATTVLQYAVDNLTAARAYKEVVKVMGNLTLSTITIPSYTVLDLYGARLFQANATNLNLLINNDTSAGNTNIEIMGGTIDGNKANQTADGTNYNTRNIINLSKCTHCSIHDITMLNSNSSAVFIGESTDIHISTNKILDARKCGVRLDVGSSSTPGAFIFVTNNYMYNLSENFVTSCTSTDFYISGNQCDTCATNGINVNGVRNYIHNNTIKNADRAGITMGGEATPFGAGDYSEIIGNTIWECKGGGIFSGVTQGGNYVTIAFNKCKGHPTLQDTSTGRAYGIRLRGNYAVIEGNQVWGWLRTGISVTGIISTSTFDSRAMSSDRNLIKNNIVHTNGQLGATETTNYLKGGISLYGNSTETTALTNQKVVGNICYNNIDYGILYRNTAGVVIEDNDLQANITDAILNVASNV